MSYKEMEATEKGRGRKGKRGVEGQQVLSSVLSVTEVSALGKVMPVMMDIKNWQGEHARDGKVYKQVYAMSCLSDVIRHIFSL